MLEKLQKNQEKSQECGGTIYRQPQAYTIENFIRLAVKYIQKAPKCWKIKRKSRRGGKNEEGKRVYIHISL